MRPTSLFFKANHLRRLTAGVAGMCFINLLACTEYTPVHGMVDPSTSAHVRVTLTEQGRMTVTPRIGQRAERVEGTLQSMTDSSLSLMVTGVSREGGIEDTYLGEQLSLNASDYEAVEKSQTSAIRSFLLAGVIVASTFLVGKGVADISGGKGSTPPPQTK